MIQPAPRKTPTPRPLTREESRRRLAANCGRLMAERGTNAFALAKRFGICYRIVRRAVAGESDPSGTLLYNLAHALETTIDDLLRPEEKCRKRT